MLHQNLLSNCIMSTCIVVCSIFFASNNCRIKNIRFLKSPITVGSKSMKIARGTLKKTRRCFREESII
uniref:Secreted protein n=1 Tax=Meloidogyne incognita TaxID=6306 RepID=A0A914MZ10_MELIC